MRPQHEDRSLSRLIVGLATPDAYAPVDLPTLSSSGLAVASPDRTLVADPDHATNDRRIAPHFSTGVLYLTRFDIAIVDPLWSECSRNDAHADWLGSAHKFEGG